MNTQHSRCLPGTYFVLAVGNLTPSCPCPSSWSGYLVADLLWRSRFGSITGLVLWKEPNPTDIFIIRTERLHNTKPQPSRPLYFRSHPASKQATLTLLHSPGSLLQRVHQPRVCLDFKHRFWWGLIMHKCIKAAVCRKAGYGQQWPPVLFANIPLLYLHVCWRATAGLQGAKALLGLYSSRNSSLSWEELGASG